MQINSILSQLANKAAFQKYNVVPFFGQAQNQPILQPSADIVQFAARGKRPKFIAPMVIENPHVFNEKNPKSVKYYADLIRKAQTFARTQVSGFNVGEVLIGNSGRAYLGCNVETKGAGPADVIHGEPFVYSQAKAYGEEGIQHLFLPANSCGSCLQLLSEAGDRSLKVTVIDPATGKFVYTKTLADLFPERFDSSGTTLQKNFFNAPGLALAPINFTDPLVQATYDSAKDCYVPKQKRRTWGAVGVEIQDGRVFTGQALTSSGPNHTVTPTQNVIIKLIAAEVPYDQIKRVVVVEPENPDYSFYWQAQGIMSNIAPQAKLDRVQVAYTPPVV